MSALIFGVLGVLVVYLLVAILLRLGNILDEVVHQRHTSTWLSGQSVVRDIHHQLQDLNILLEQEARRHTYEEENPF